MNYVLAIKVQYKIFYSEYSSCYAMHRILVSLIFFKGCLLEELKSLKYNEFNSYIVYNLRCFPRVYPKLTKSYFCPLGLRLSGCAKLE